MGEIFKPVVSIPVVKHATDVVTRGNVHLILDEIRESGGECRMCDRGLKVVTREGEMLATFEGHRIIKGIEGEFYPIEIAIFNRQYRPYEPKGVPGD